MTDKLKIMTDNEIVKALETCCIERVCSKCSYSKNNSAECINDIMKDTLDLINRLQAENERLTDTLNATIAGQETLQRYIITAKAEAYKEFAERLKEKLHLNGVVMGSNCAIVEDTDIDNLVKEMEGDNNA